MRSQDQDQSSDPAAPPEEASVDERFDDLVARCRAEQDQLAAIGQQARDLLSRLREEAQARANEIVSGARTEAARLLADARREVADLEGVVARLRESQREAAERLEATRRALEGALGGTSAPAPAPTPVGPEPRSAAPPADAAPEPGPARANPKAPDPHPGLTSFSLELQQPAATPIPARLYLKPAMVVLAAAGLVAIIGLALPWLSGAPAEERPSATGAAATPERPTPLLSTSDAAGDGAVPTGALDDATPAKAELELAPNAEATTVDPSPSPPAAPAADGTLHVRLEARRPSWIRATVDGVRESGSVLQPGQTREISASERISIRAGDAGALMVVVNGEAPVPFGRNGQVLTRHFGQPRAEARPEPEEEVPASARASSTNATPSPPPTAAPPVRSAPAPVEPGESSAPAPPQPSAELPFGTPEPPTTVRQQILQADRQWFDAFYRGEKTLLARLNAPGFEMVDERPPALRFGAGAEVRARALSEVRVDTHGDGAVLSARMIERVIQDGRAGQYESYISEIWIRRDGQWRLMGLRLASAGQVQESAGAVP